MLNLTDFADLIAKRMQELDVRMHAVDHELGEPMSADMNDQSIDLEDDEVLEGIGNAAQKEIGLLKQAMHRIENGTYGICQKCDEPISEERLVAVLYAPLCKRCATQAQG